ncbi:apolipoprotein N-acyltransferase [bacterium]|nr:apolipoprotein N-acyltransferase [bacterium]
MKSRTLAKGPSLFQKTEMGFLLAALSGLLLFLSFPGYNLYLLEWIAFLPLLYALEGRSVYRAYLLGSVAGMVAVFGGFSWTVNLAVSAMATPFPFSVMLAVAYAVLTGQVFAVSIGLFQWCRERHRSVELLLFPVILVTVFSLFPILFRFKLGDGQSYFLQAIQAIEFTGVYGLDFVLGLVNILVYRLIQPRGEVRFTGLWIGCLLIPVLWFAYGVFSLGQWDARIQSWETKRIGVIQPNRPARLGEPQPEKGFSREYPLDMKLSEKLAAEGAEIVFWPEGHFYGITFWEDVRRAFQRRIRKMGIPLVIFDSTLTMRNGDAQYHNSSILLGADGEQQGIYHKIKLVPFGEYTPLVGRSNFLKWLLGDFPDSLVPGKQFVTFDAAGMRIVPAICYEPLFPRFIASAIGSAGQGKLILVQSQDGWYGKSSQPEQHTAVTVLRAVENRVPLVHVINNGSSAGILPNGRYRFRSPSFVRGAWVIAMPYHRDSGGSFYSSHPLLFIGLIWLLFSGCVAPGMIKKVPFFRSRL